MNFGSENVVIRGRKLPSIPIKDLFLPGLQAMVRDGLFSDIDAAKIHFTKLENKYHNKTKAKQR